MSAEENPTVEVACTVQLDYSERINFAFQQNSIPVIRRLKIQNNTEQDWTGIQCQFRPQPDWAEPYEITIEQIPAGTVYTLSDITLKLEIDYLANLSERVRGEISLEISKAVSPDQGEESLSRDCLFKRVHPVDVYAYDEWTGLRSLPEILAAFVTPNLAVVEQLLSNAAKILGERTSDSSLDGYQSKSKKRVYQIVNAIYDSVRERGISYSNPPASFENTGQRVRFATRIMKSRLGTCLDLSLLFASLLEQAGLHPLILIHKGHSYVGCWLIEESFSDPATDDLQSVRKRKELEELFVFESTLACDGKGADFNQAVDAAGPHLSLDDIFENAIDVHRCRSSRIRPLPLERNEGDVDVQKAHETRKNVVTASHSRTREIEFRPELVIDGTPRTPEGRVEHWKQQLLDLTLRNRLLNFKETKQTVPLLCPKPEQIEDELAADQTYKVLEQTPLVAGSDPRSLSQQAWQTDEDPVVEHLIREIHAKRLRSSLTEKELSRRLLEIYRNVRLENEESGANTLYLALGFLEWKQNRHDDRSFMAPLLLVPVQLHRKSVQSGFTLQRHDEDTLINVTLLELLKRDYMLDVPGVNPPPEDDSGIDVEQVFRLFQHAIRDLPGWEVHREVWLAQFSFSKFLLWKDLQDRTEVLSKNAVVKHLIHTPGAPFPDGLDDLNPHELDDVLGFEQIYCPMSSDSSQLAATLAAARGKNFVMNGPPGTGKSQTITNIISHCLAEGKRVLFVAEKRAALQVVHHRLSQIGLGPFCLELHSNKSGKTEVLRQFGEAINYVEQYPGDEWSTLAKRLNGLRDELNGYVRELHKIYPNKLTAYHCFAWLFAHAEKGDSFQDCNQLDIPEIENQPHEARQSLEEICEQLIMRGSDRRLPSEAKNALQPVKATEWTPSWEDRAIDANTQLLDSIGNLRTRWSEVATHLGLPESSASEAILATAVELTGALRYAPALPATFITESNWSSSFKPKAESWIQSGRQRDDARNSLKDFNLDALWQLDTDNLEKTFNTIVGKKGFLKPIKLWLQLRPIRSARNVNSGKWSASDAPGFFENIRQLKQAQTEIDTAQPEATSRLGAHWNEGEADWDILQELLDYGDGLQAGIKELAGDSVDLLIQLRNKIGDLIGAGSEFLQEGGIINKQFADYGVAWEAFETADKTHQEIFRIQRKQAIANLLDRTETICKNLVDYREFLSAWCRWQQAYQQADVAGLKPVLMAVGNERLPLERLREAFEYAYRNTFLKRLLTLSPTLREFYGEEHQKRIDTFKNAAEHYTRLTGQIIAARLAAQLPRARKEECPRSTELGMIQREMAKRRRHKPVRKLLAETPGVTPYLKPCFLMSPLSVAQYLDAEQTDFDIVVFDEASQIPVWDAIGAIARGKQVIVVGDPKQLPPTNFFSRSDGDDGYADDSQAEDLESILDECLGSGLKTYSLLWHYRSRKEGLIAFSNYHYYGNKLYTFPSPHSENIGVSLIPVPKGFYDKGKSRTNRAEAEAITREILRRLTDTELSKLSIGVVTFSQAQQSLILDFLDEVRRKHPEIEGYFGDEADEPVFVKNLENVQGDERDVILFSICYGPDQAGRLSMNFGPLNRDGGERRLNVAVTRAKHEVVIYSTLRSEQIDLSRTRSLGVTHLKSYLEYAERGPAAIAGNIESAHTENYDSIFEEEVADFLRSKGYTVHTQVGCSGYRVDLAIVHPDSPGHYLLGIECDGATYHRTATARDRDRLRQAVLEGLGWRIYRIWSTDWWRNADMAQEDLLAEVEDSLKAPAEQELIITETPAKQSEPKAVHASNVQVARLQANQRKQDYPEVTLLPQAPANNFYEHSSGPLIRSQVQRIIENEGPIRDELIIRRVTQEWGFNRVASRIRAIVEKHLPSKHFTTELGGARTFWPESVDPENYCNYRVNDRDHRKFEDIPYAEIRNAALDTLEKYIAYPQDSFAAEIARHFGFSRVTGSTAQVCEDVIQEMLKRGDIRSDGNDYKVYTE